LRQELGFRTASAAIISTIGMGTLLNPSLYIIAFFDAREKKGSSGSIAGGAVKPHRQTAAIINSMLTTPKFDAVSACV